MKRPKRVTHHYGFIPMATVVPEGKIGNVQIDHFTIGKHEARTNLRWMLHPEEAVTPGTYARLTMHGQVIMSDTPHEQRTNFEVVHRSRGDVFIAGLGFGMVLVPILKNPAVTSVHVLEENDDIRTLVESHLRKAVGVRASKKLTVIAGDVFSWLPPADVSYDTIYFDIWNDQSTDELATMTKLHRRFRKHLRPGGWMESWRRSHLRAQKDRERRRGW